MEFAVDSPAIGDPDCSSIDPKRVSLASEEYSSQDCLKENSYFVFIARTLQLWTARLSDTDRDARLGRTMSLISPFSSSTPRKTAFHSKLSEIEES
jgi:hypothetical protein